MLATPEARKKTKQKVGRNLKKKRRRRKECKVGRLEIIKEELDSRRWAKQAWLYRDLLQATENL